MSSGGTLIPLHRVLPDNQIGTGQRRLLGGNIDIKVGIGVDRGSVSLRLQASLPVQAFAYSHENAADKDAHKLSESLIGLRLLLS
ncbi:hypothetical protein LNQ52_04160 [Klebsiella pneumoniae subsp. pneumoniae]|nr:hypothetical protein [Klebsiella pneumoniae subsp. pneumoniae]